MSSDSITSPQGGEREENDAASGSASGSDAAGDAESKRGPFGGLTPQEAAKKGWEKRRERLAQGLGPARRERDLRREIREQLEDDADEVLLAVKKAIREGRDVRALTSLLDRVYGDDTATARPTTVAEIQAMDTQQLVAYIAQLEAERASQQLASDAQPMEDSGPEA